MRARTIFCLIKALILEQTLWLEVDSVANSMSEESQTIREREKGRKTAVLSPSLLMFVT